VSLIGVPPFSNLQLQNQPEAYQNIHSQDASECEGEDTNRGQKIKKL
jgi:hypothetical protein